jgi:hypothetical protein
MKGEGFLEDLLFALVSDVMGENTIKDNNGLYKKVVASIWNKESLEVCENTTFTRATRQQI